jgi:hypothetical protein
MNSNIVSYFNIINFPLSFYHQREHKTLNVMFVENRLSLVCCFKKVISLCIRKEKISIIIIKIIITRIKVTSRHWKFFLPCYSIIKLKISKDNYIYFIKDCPSSNKDVITFKKTKITSINSSSLSQ